MSALTTIFMPVLNEGTDVWRPVSAQGRGVDRFLVTGPMPDGEEWKFHEGSLVPVTVVPVTVHSIHGSGDSAFNSTSISKR